MIDAKVIAASIDRSAHEVLVVDDNPATRYTTTRVLVAAGFRTREAQSGAAALEEARRGISAVVLDVHLPDMSGFDVCRELRANPLTSALPVVHLSAEFTRNEDRVAGLEAGADAYLVHPVEPAILVGDDRVHLDTVDGQLWVRPVPELAGLIEIRGLGIRRCAFAGEAVVGLIADLAATDAARLPATESLVISLNGVSIPRIPVGRDTSPLPLVVAALTTTKSSSSVNPSGDCLKGNGNHMNPTLATE